MQTCTVCGKKIKYIATLKGVVKCETNPIEVYTENGRHYTAYPIHNCTGKSKDEKK